MTSWLRLRRRRDEIQILVCIKTADAGCSSKKKFGECHEFCKRTYRYEVNREVWGYADYSEPLTDKEVAEYDLVKGGEVHD